MTDTLTTAAPAAAVRRRRFSSKAGALITALVLIGAALTAWGYFTASDRTEVLIVAADVPLGSAIDEADLDRIFIGTAGGLEAVPATETDDIVGRFAAVALSPGMLLAPAHVAEAPLVGDGQQQIALPMSAEELPAAHLEAGWVVAIVDVTEPGPAGLGDAEAPLEPPTTWEAIVIDTAEYTTTASSAVTVYLAVDAGEAAAIVALAARDDVALTLQGAGG